MKIGFLHSDGPYLGIVFGAFAPASDKRKAGTRRHLGINGLYRKSKRRAAARKNYGARLRRHRGLRAGFLRFFQTDCGCREGGWTMLFVDWISCCGSSGIMSGDRSGARQAGRE